MVDYATIQIRRGTTAEWNAANNPVLAVGEPGQDVTTGELRVGDGVRRFNELPKSPAVDATTNIFSNSDVMKAMGIEIGIGNGPRDFFSGGLTDSNVFGTFGAGHGWTLSQAGSGTITEDTTARGPYSDRSIAIAIGNTASATQLSKTLASAVLTADGPLTIWFRFATGQANPQGFEIRLGDASLANAYAWSVYPGTPATQNADGWTALELFPKTAIVVGTPATLNTIRIRPFANTTVNIGAVAQRRTSPIYPNGVISLRFDDGYDTQYTLGMPALAKYGMPGTLVFIADRLGVSGGITLPQLREMRIRAGWEIGAHSFTTAAHDGRFVNLTPAQADDEFYNLKRWLVSRGFDTSVWASPGGVSNAAVWEVARKYFSAHWGVSGGLSDAQQGGLKNTPRPVYPAHIPSVSYDATNAPVSAMQAVIADVVANKTWGTLTFHAIAPASSSSSGNIINVTDLDALLQAIANAGIPVQTPNQILRRANIQ